MNAEIVLGRYFSDKGMGKARGSVLIGLRSRLALRRKLLQRRRRKCPSLLPCMGGNDAADSRVLQATKRYTFLPGQTSVVC